MTPDRTGEVPPSRRAISRRRRVLVCRPPKASPPPVRPRRRPDPDGKSPRARRGSRCSTPSSPTGRRQTGEPFVPSRSRRLRRTTSTANCGRTASGRSWRRAGSRCRRARPTTRRQRTTVHGLGTRKNDLVLELIRRDGVEVYEGSVRFVEAARAAGLRPAVVSASRNCREVLIAAGIERPVRGAHRRRRRSRARTCAGKPAPDTFLAAADALGVEPAQCGRLRGRRRGRRGRPGRGVRLGRRRRPRRARRTRCATTAPTSSSPISSELLEEP